MKTLTGWQIGDTTYSVMDYRPIRKQFALACSDGHVQRAVAYFKDPDDAEAFAEWLNKLANGLPS